MFDFVLATEGLVSYLAVFALLLAGAFGLPVPEDVALIAAGALIHNGKATAPLMALMCYCGIIVGDMIIYRVGYLAGPTLFRKRWFRRLVTASRLQAMRGNLEKRTFTTIFIARHLFYLRTATFLVCGAVRLSVTRFLIADLLAALLTTPLMLYLGYLFAEHHEILFAWIEQVKILLVVMGLGFCAWLLYRWRTRSVEMREDDDC